MNPRRTFLGESTLASVDYVAGSGWNEAFTITDGSTLIVLTKDQGEKLVEFMLEHLGQGEGCEEKDFAQGRC